jgi:hypothetical protein
MIQDDIVNRFAGQVDLPQGTEGVRFTITNFLPFGMGAVAFNSPTFVTVSNDVIYDGQVFPVDATNHVPSPGGGEFFSNPISNINDCFTFQQGPFGCFANARTGLDVQHQLIFDVFHAYDPGVLELQDVLGLSTVIPADLAPFPFEQTIARATIQIGGPAFEAPSFYFAGSPRPIPEPSSLLLLLGLLGVIGLLRVGKRRKLLRP